MNVAWYTHLSIRVLVCLLPLLWPLTTLCGVLLQKSTAAVCCVSNSDDDEEKYAQVGSVVLRPEPLVDKK